MKAYNYSAVCCNECGAALLSIPTEPNFTTIPPERERVLVHEENKYGPKCSRAGTTFKMPVFELEEVR